MNKQIFIAFVLFSLLVSTSNAQNDNSLLWKIEGDSIKTSYVFGTMHLMPQEDFVLKDKVKNAFNEAEVVYLELDMDDPSFMADMMKYSMLEEGDELKAHMDSTEYVFLNQYMNKNIGVGLKQLNRFKPLSLTSMIMTTLMGKQLASYELTFINMAKEAEKELKGLETIASQIAVFDKIPYDEQIDDIIKMLKSPEETKKLYVNMIALYKAEDITKLFESMDDYFDNDQEMMKSLLFDRNENWVKQIPEISKKQKIFYAVGAGHLGGDKGVIKLLKSAGYIVTPVLD
ncbi:MAG TPA: TraB/GumN family protein [Flavobacteriaceae bacterium]|jgi:uncharacterized protein YbaP (TraB family)|nr:TraB/GumN family protein [Flavobacteriaceae bacterium]HBS13149.1 TraB/GumN family protein [Flavobacteriaceae bacterium]